MGAKQKILTLWSKFIPDRLPGEHSPVSSGKRFVLLYEMSRDPAKNGVTRDYERSGKSAVYSCHQEVPLELFKEWA